jgi:hypothetical protein
MSSSSLDLEDVVNWLRAHEAPESLIRLAQDLYEKAYLEGYREGRTDECDDNESDLNDKW